MSGFECFIRRKKEGFSSRPSSLSPCLSVSQTTAPRSSGKREVRSLRPLPRRGYNKAVGEEREVAEWHGERKTWMDGWMDGRACMGDEGETMGQKGRAKGRCQCGRGRLLQG